MVEVGTPHGPARVHLEAAPSTRAALVLGHGAGGGVGAPDLRAAADAALAAGLSVALVEQPYRVAGRRSPGGRGSHLQLDAAWLAVIEWLRAGPLEGLPLIVGGRSAGARVACRTADAAGAVAVLCLAFPVHPPGRADDPEKSRLPELEGLHLPVLVVQGDRDPFGVPPEAPGRTVVRIPGDHSLRAPAPVREAVNGWLGSLDLRSPPAARSKPPARRRSPA